MSKIYGKDVDASELNHEMVCIWRTILITHRFSVHRRVPHYLANMGSNIDSQGPRPMGLQ